MDNIGNKTSIKNISNSLKINVEIINLYIDKKYLEIKEEIKKYYLVDVSFRFANIGTKKRLRKNVR